MWPLLVFPSISPKYLISIASILFMFSSYNQRQIWRVKFWKICQRSIQQTIKYEIYLTRRYVLTSNINNLKSVTYFNNQGFILGFAAKIRFRRQSDLLKWAFLVSLIRIWEEGTCVYHAHRSRCSRILRWILFCKTMAIQLIVSLLSNNNLCLYLVVQRRNKTVDHI